MKNHSFNFSNFKIFGMACLLLLGCNTENIVAKRDNQLSALVSAAEQESDCIQPVYNSQRDSLEFKQNGLSKNYLTNSYLFLDKSPDYSLDSGTTFMTALNLAHLNQSQIQEINARLEHYIKSQEIVINIAKSSIVYCNDSLKNYKIGISRKLKEKLISVTDYDQLMTESSMNFESVLRQMYEDKKIKITASQNYRTILIEIQSVLTQKQWEDFFSCVYKK